jgi:lysophospholipase L1-like esterase
MSRTRTLASAALAALGLGAGVAVPVVELHLLRRRNGPNLPAHPLDTTLGSSPDGRCMRVVWLGDSLASGVGAAGPEGSLPHQVAERLGHQVELSVLARPGARVADVVGTQLGELEGRGNAADLILVSVGSNDVAHLTRRRDFVRDYNAMLDALAPAAVAVLSIPDMGSALILAQPLRAIVGVRARVVDRWIRRAVRRHPNVRHIDIANRRRDAHPVRRYLSEDLYHPNEHGYREWAEVVAAALAGWSPAGQQPT